MFCILFDLMALYGLAAFSSKLDGPYSGLKVCWFSKMNEIFP